MVGTATRDIVPQKSALGENFRPGIAADRFTPVPTLKKQAPPTTMTIDAHSGDNVIADINPATGVAVRSYVTPTLDGNISMTDIGGSTYYYNSDLRQSVKNLTDTSAAVAQSYDYTAFGDKVDSRTSGSVNQRYTYTGRELNDVSGDYYFRYRAYSTYLGSFYQRDPKGYIDGMLLNSGYFAKHMAYDPMGTRRRRPGRVWCSRRVLIRKPWPWPDVFVTQVYRCSEGPTRIPGEDTIPLPPGFIISAEECLKAFGKKPTLEDLKKIRDCYKKNKHDKLGFSKCVGNVLGSPDILCCMIRKAGDRSVVANPCDEAYKNQSLANCEDCCEHSACTEGLVAAAAIDFYIKKCYCECSEEQLGRK